MFERSVLVNLLANFLEEAKSSAHVDSKWWRTPELDGCVGHEAETARKAKVGDGADQAKLPGFSRLVNGFFCFHARNQPCARPKQRPHMFCLVHAWLGWLPPKGRQYDDRCEGHSCRRWTGIPGGVRGEICWTVFRVGRGPEPLDARVRLHFDVDTLWLFRDARAGQRAATSGSLSGSVEARPCNRTL